MRMWKVDPTKLCRQHLLGEHVEMHMFVGCINKKINLDGYINRKLIEIHHIKDRHEILVNEMNRRNMNHKSPLPEFKSYHAGDIDIDKNIEELKRRCSNCSFI